MSLVTSRSNHDRRIILSYQEKISFSLSRIMRKKKKKKKNPGLYTAMKSAVTLYLVCKLLKKKKLVISLGSAGSAVPRSTVPQISATLNFLR